MGVQIAPAKTGGLGGGTGFMGSSLMKSPILGIVKGFLTGGASGAAQAAVGAKTGGDSDGTDSASKGIADNSTLSTPQFGDSATPDPMSRRMSVMDNQDLSPEQHIDNGISLLNHPDVPDDMRDVAATYLYGAKHFGGSHPDIDKYLSQYSAGG